MKIEAPAWSHNRTLGIFNAITNSHRMNTSKTYPKQEALMATMTRAWAKDCDL